MMPGRSANCWRTSSTTSCAHFPTAWMARPEKTKTSMPPNRPPTNTSGTAKSTVEKGRSDCSCTTSMKAEKSRKHARPAEPMEYPLVAALVTFPTASRRSVMSRTISGWSLISTMPPALSAIGPKVSIARTYTAEESIPIVATDVPKRPPPGIATLPMWYAMRMEEPVHSTAMPVDSRPTATPMMMLVPWPEVEALAILRTGSYR
mmetsp:Transcript_17343/g.39739  ORF Transcript_17343/g.39739 Transcript_17343/m.39739 type:complete len:205 (+) Transcript_17343:272-886(+)